MTTVSLVIDYLKTSSPTETATYLVNLPECQNKNIGSIRSVIQRLKQKLARFRASANSPKGKQDLENFLQSPFPFPPRDDTNKENAQ